MASLGRDMYMQTNNREDSASPILSAGMEGLFSLMNTIHTHPPSSRLLHEYSSASKSLSHSSNLLQALTNGGNDVASESEGLSLPNSHATTSALTRTSPFDDQATSLHRSIKQEATASVDSESGASVLGRQKRMRSSMECKGPEKEVLDTRKRSKHNENGYNLHAKTEPENTEKIKCTPPRAEKSRDMKTRKQSGSTAEQNSQGVRSNVSKSSSPVSEQGSPPKPEYIHVRARRGQATDSHSLAERVRREKISERMKYLQDLVPSCIKVTGKAMMLDEIINYVQSLQRQVEFLSMKLAAIPPNSLEYSFDALFGRKEAIRLNGNNTNSIVHNTPVQATLAQYSRNDHSSFLNTGNRNLIFPANTRPQQDVARYGMQLQINPNDQLAMSYTSADPPFFRDISSDMGVEESLLYHSAAGSNNCSLAASPAHAILEPAQHSYVQQNANLEMEWDDDLQNIVQQMGCAPQAGSPWLPGDHLFTEEGFSLPANIKNEL